MGRGRKAAYNFYVHDALIDLSEIDPPPFSSGARPLSIKGTLERFMAMVADLLPR